MNDNSSRLQLITVMVINIVSVVGVVILNKKLFSEEGFLFPNTLMALHFVITSVGIWMYQKISKFELPEQQPKTSTCLQISGLQLGSVMFVNYSLVYNSVGVYQILKLMNIPVICFAEYLLKNIRYPYTIKISLLLLISGVYLTTAGDVSVTFIGLVFGCLGTLSTALLQIKMKDLTADLTSQQSLLYTSPYTAMLFLCCAIITDDISVFLFTFQLTYHCMALLALSGIAALCINLSVFFIVGKTDPMSYQVVGHVKTVLVLLCGVMFFSHPFSLQNTSGMMVAMIGVIWYTKLKLQPAIKEAELPPTPENPEITICVSPALECQSPRHHEGL